MQTEMNTTDIAAVKNWAKRRGYLISEDTAKDLAQKSIERSQGVSYEQLDIVWNSRSAAPAAPTVATAEDKQNIKTMLNWHPRYANVKANEEIVLAALQAKSLPVTVENFNAVFPQVVNRLAISETWRRAFGDFFQKFPQFAVTESNRLLMERSLRGADVTFENLADLCDTGNPDYCADKLAISGFGLEQQSQQRQQKSDDAEKKQLIESLTSGLTDDNGNPLHQIARGNKSPRQVYAGEVARLESLPLEVLREQSAARGETRRLRGLTPAQLREEVKKTSGPVPQQYQPITPQFKVPGKEVYVPWSKRLWISLPPSMMRQCLKLYGPEQINKACGLS